MRAVPIVFLALALAAAMMACSSKSTGSGSTRAAPAAPGSPAAGATTNEKPVPQEKSPAGDIPDTQAFVSFTPPGGGYTVEAPEGWARSMTGTTVQFADKLDGESVTIGATRAAPTAATARNDLVPALTGVGRAVQVTKVQDVALPGGAAVLVTYTSNSDPDPVTGKQVRLENNTYYFFSNGRLATLTLWAPLGADNVDQWQRISKSFTWS